ncbi:MAG: C4-dicarboxylate ABC transporter substrate-binding protein, partial [Rhodobiaceae bacterium]
MQLKHIIHGGAVASMVAFGAAQAFAEQFVSIGTGGVTGVYYPTG